MGQERVNSTVCKKSQNEKVTYSLKMFELQMMVEVTEKHVPQDSACVRGRNLNTGSACRCTPGVSPSRAVGVGAQHLDNVSFISSSKLLSRVGSLHFPSMDTEFSPFKRKERSMAEALSSASIHCCPHHHFSTISLFPVR